MRRWCVRLIAVLGVAITAYLCVKSFGVATLVGCGAASGCDQVLASRWSHWLGLPVAVVGLGLWLVILISAFIQWARPVLTAAALLGGGAAVWFILLQFTRVDALCPYCMAAHGCALILVGLVMADRASFTRTGTLAASLAMIALVGGQVFFVRAPSGSVSMAYNPTGGRKASGGPSMVGRAPVVGDPRADHVLIVYFDYTCPHCRRVHHYLDQAMNRYGDQIALAMAPVPLDAACNPAYRSTAPEHKNACELASLALAVSAAKPGKFAAINRYLFQGKHPPTLEAARRFAANLVGKTQLKDALTKPWIARFIHAKINESNQIGKQTKTGGLIPKVLTANKLLFVGEPANPRQVFKTLESQLGVKAVKSAQG